MAEENPAAQRQTAVTVQCLRQWPTIRLTSSQRLLASVNVSYHVYCMCTMTQQTRDLYQMLV